MVLQSLRSMPGAFMTRLARTPGALVLGGLFLLMALAGAAGKWVSFPMTAPVKAGQIAAGGLPLSFGALFALFLFAGALCGLFARRTALVLLVAALVLLLRLPLEIATRHPEWLQALLEQGAERMALSQFLLENFAMNLSPEPTFVALDRIDGSNDQLVAAWRLLSWPWFLSLGAGFGLLCTLHSGPAGGGRLRWTAGAAVILGAAALAPPLLSLSQAQAVRERGDQLLVGGRGTEAVAAYREAYARNPGLLSSRSFWVMAAAAQAQAAHGRHPYAPLVPALALALRRTPLDDAETYAAAARTLANPGLPPPADAFDAAIQATVESLERDYLVKQALLELDAGKRIDYLVALLRSRPQASSAARFYLADAWVKQGGYAEAVALLRELDTSVTHPTVRADVLCTIGDVLTAQGRLVEARESYIACKDLDELTNYRVTKALGGT